jgi:hypothetical protein
MKLTIDQPVITPTGKTGRVVAKTRCGIITVRLDPFVPDWAGQGRGQKLRQKRRRWLGTAQPRRLIGVEVVYRAKELLTAVLADPDAAKRLT